VDALDVRQSPDGHTLETRGARMRFNIRQRDRDQPVGSESRVGYEDVLTALYSELARRHPVLHELEEAAKVGAAAAWIRTQDPAFALADARSQGYAPPKRMAGIIFLSLDLVRGQGGDNSLMFSAEGGISLSPFGHANADIGISDVIHEDVQVVDLRGLTVDRSPAGAGLIAASRLAGIEAASVPQPVAWVRREVVNGRVSTVVSLETTEMLRDAPASVRRDMTPTDKMVVWRTSELDGRIAETRKAVTGAQTDRDRARQSIVLGELLFERGDIAAAIQELNRGVALDPTSPVLHLFEARALLADGKRDQAIVSLETYVRLEPLNQGAKRYLQDLREMSGSPAGASSSGAGATPKLVARANRALAELAGMADTPNARPLFDSASERREMQISSLPEPSAVLIDGKPHASSPRYRELWQKSQATHEAVRQSEDRAARLEKEVAAAPPQRKAEAQKALVEEKEKRAGLTVGQQDADEALLDFTVSFGDDDTGSAARKDGP
jgi:tetratricopeptide (TPR) repeat protein